MPHCLSSSLPFEANIVFVGLCFFISLQKHRLKSQIGN
nr:MAG TPA: hypothetical protein [Caudoviricetes sp.]